MKKSTNDIYDALELLEKEKGIPVDFMLEKIKKAIITACKSSYNGNDDAIINMDCESKKFEVYLRKTVVEDVTNKAKEISLNDARLIDPNVAIDDKVAVSLDTKQFGRIAAQTARNIIRQGIRDSEREQIMIDMQNKMHEVVSAVVERVDDRTGNATLKIGRAEMVLPKSEQVKGEVLKEGNHIKIYIVDVREGDKGPRVIISRTHPDFVKRLFEIEVPEIHDGTIQIKSVSREAGARTKIAVVSTDPNVDAIGACVGSKGSRISMIINELSGEKIDLIEYDESIEKYVSAALAPAKVKKVTVIDPDIPSCKAIVPNDQLSLAIGNKGQNVRLAARLTGCKIDINPDNEVAIDETIGEE